MRHEEPHTTLALAVRLRSTRSACHTFGAGRPGLGPSHFRGRPTGSAGPAWPTARPARRRPHHGHRPALDGVIQTAPELLCEVAPFDARVFRDETDLI